MTNTCRSAFITTLFLAYCFLGCKNTNSENTAFVLETFSPNAIEYPTVDVHIPDSVQQQFTQNFFVPWHRSEADLLNSLADFPGKPLSYLDNYLNDGTWYGENKKPHKEWQRKEVVATVDIGAFPNFLQKGIVIAHTDLRRIPTHRPGFDTFAKAGEGYPFDYFQETNLWAGTPLQLLHLTKDKQWCYVLSPYYKGWVAMHDIAIVSNDFMAEWTIDTYAMPLLDGAALNATTSHYAITTKMGMLLPFTMLPNTPNQVMVYYANADENQNAQILKALVDKNTLAFDNHPFNQNNLKLLITNILGNPYGWGGSLGNRDCSSLIRDLLATYKIWLPRDSKDQIKIGKPYELTGTADEKIYHIKENAVPFLSILRKKGHNMLYVGNAPNGDPLILHAIWGLKSSYANNQLADYLRVYPLEGMHQVEDGTIKGRYIIGETVITTVTAGKDNDAITTPLDDIYMMTTILEN